MYIEAQIKIAYPVWAVLSGWFDDPGILSH